MDLMSIAKPFMVKTQPKSVFGKDYVGPEGAKSALSPFWMGDSDFTK
jgi:hypothetical protein